MKTIAIFAAISLSGGSAFAQEHPLFCWYNEHAAYTGADGAPPVASLGKVEKTGHSGDRAYSYVVSANDGTACPNELPLGTKTAMTVPLVRQDDANCTNDDVSAKERAATGGSVTVFRRSNGTTDVLVHLAGGASPNTTYEFYLKCIRKLGSVRTDGNGNGDASFDFLPETTGSTLAFDMYPQGAPSGSRYQSLRLTRN